VCNKLWFGFNSMTHKNMLEDRWDLSLTRIYNLLNAYKILIYNTLLNVHNFWLFMIWCQFTFPCPFWMFCPSWPLIGLKVDHCTLLMFCCDSCKFHSNNFYVELFRNLYMRKGLVLSALMETLLPVIGKTLYCHFNHQIRHVHVLLL
jgi:hypothetical protein